jgi:hypothetical protein
MCVYVCMYEYKVSELSVGLKFNEDQTYTEGHAD